MPFPEFHCRTLHDLRRHTTDFTQNNGMQTYGFVVEMRKPRNDDQRDLQFLTNHPDAWRRSLEQSLETGTPHNMVRHASLHLPPLGWSASGHLAGHTIIDDLARQEEAPSDHHRPDPPANYPSVSGDELRRHETKLGSVSLSPAR